jgi:hypothetical protein
VSETNALKGRDRATVRAFNLNPAVWRVPTIPVSNGHEVRGIFGMYPAKGVSSVVPRPNAYSSPAFPRGLLAVVAQKLSRSQRMLIRDRDSRPCSEICPFSESGYRDGQNRESPS